MRKKVKVYKKKGKEGRIKFLDRRLSLNQRVQNMFFPFYGIERSTSTRLSSQVGVLDLFRSSELPFFLWSKLEKELDRTYLLGRLCEKEKKERIDFYKKIGCYRGLRFSQGLPVHGQRTHTNAQTMKRMYRRKDVQGKKKKIN